jgi:hypothetical protein
MSANTRNNGGFTKEQLDALSNIAVNGSDSEYVLHQSLITATCNKVAARIRD